MGTAGKRLTTRTMCSLQQENTWFAMNLRKQRVTHELRRRRCAR